MEEQTNDELETGQPVDEKPQPEILPPERSPLDLDKNGVISRNETIIAVTLIVGALIMGGGAYHALASGTITLEQLGGVLGTVWTVVHTGQKALGK